MNWSAGTPLLS